MKKGLLFAPFVLSFFSLVLAKTQNFDSLVTGAAAGDELLASPVLAIIILLIVLGLVILWIKKTRK